VTSASRPFAIPAALWLLAIGAVPLLRLLAEALGGSAVAAAFEDPAVWRAAGRSLGVSLVAAALATLIGGALAWALLLRGLPGRGVLLFLAVLPALVPAQIMALGWIKASGPASPLLLALDLAPPAGFPDPRSIRVMPLDAGRAAREQADILRRFAQLAGG
jgi:iron(III) transport system permease protein